MSRLQRLLVWIAVSLFLVCFLWIIYLFLFVGKNYIDPQPLFILIGALFFAGFYLFLFSVGRQLEPRNRRRTEISVVALIFAVYLVLQLLVATEFRTNFEQSWDFGIVARTAMEYTLYQLPPGIYFISFPNNTALLFLLIGCFKLASFFGYYNFTNVGILVNLLMIDAAIMIAYLSVRRITGSRTAALVALVSLMMTLPLLAYIAIYYTDTLTLLFPILSLYLWQCAKDSFCRQQKAKGWIQIGFCVFSCALGSLLKISVIIVLISILIDALLTVKLKQSAVFAAAMLLLFTALYFPVNSAIKNAPFLPQNAEDVRIPWTHWIMMGLHGNGNYYDPDYQMTLHFPPDEREALILEEIERRLSDYGFAGLMKHQAEKTAFVWGDGDYYTHIKLMRDRVQSSSLDSYVIYDGTRHAIYANYSQFMQLALYIGFILSGIFILKRSNFGMKLFPYLISIFGLFLFQNIWEARSRYLLNFLPVFAVTAICGFFQLYQWLPGFIAARRLRRVAKRNRT